MFPWALTRSRTPICLIVVVLFCLVRGERRAIGVLTSQEKCLQGGQCEFGKGDL